MQIILYKFSKKINSTAQPTSSTESLTLECFVKTPSSLISPAVQLSKGTEPIDYNYAYIADWGRYYFINDIEYSMGYWTLYLSVDVLASFKTGILGSEQYVLRSASSSDGSILDFKYPAKGSSSHGKTYGGNVVINAGSPVSGYFDGILWTGCWVVQVYSNNNSGVTTYALNNAAFVSLMSNLTSYVPSDISDVSAGIAKAMFDPLQYITSVMWFPRFPDKDAGTAQSSIIFGGYSVSVSGTCVSFDSSIWDRMYCDITVAKHSDVASYPYMQLSPYSNYDLYFEPFGKLPLDSTKLYGVNTIRCNWYLEYQKGLAHLEVTDASNTGNVIATADSQFGIEIPISQMTVDYIGAAANILGGTVGTLESLISGDIVGTIGRGAEAIGNGIASMIPIVSGKGTPGSFLIFRGEAPRIEHQFFNIVGRNNNLFGSPLCQTVQLSTLSGFCMCSNALISLPCTESERGTIESYLNSGVFLE